MRNLHKICLSVYLSFCIYGLMNGWIDDWLYICLYAYMCVCRYAIAFVGAYLQIYIQTDGQASIPTYLQFEY